MSANIIRASTTKATPICTIYTNARVIDENALNAKQLKSSVL